MRAHSAPRTGVCAAVLLAACVSNPAPSGWLPPAQEVAREAYGGWILVDTAREARRGWYATGGSGSGTDVEGELIAVDPDTVFVMSRTGLVAVPKAAVHRATLFAYDAQWGGLAGWAVLGTLSTVSNGGFLILTAPLWIIVSTSATASRSRAPMVELADQGDRWEKLRLYARFPQGLPPGLERGSLQPAARQGVGKGGGK